MANSEQMDLLKRGTRAWNAWRAQQTEATIDLSGGALRGLDLEGADLSGADLRDADLRGANLSGANLTAAHLEGSNLFKAIIDGADLNEADLRGVQFLQCPQLESAHNWQSAYRDEDLACGAAIPSR
ncbi:MAG: pentapeptide repeat-containing protein [Alphaproteobacteria bacterium]|nr:pentapeptide repeat-containing protein [Alphaproteobacteria bacterium]